MKKIKARDLCWLTYKAIDITAGMLISKQLAKTPRKVSSVVIDESNQVVTIIVGDGWIYLSKVANDHLVEVLSYSDTHAPVIVEVTS